MPLRIEWVKQYLLFYTYPDTDTICGCGLFPIGAMCYRFLSNDEVTRAAANDACAAISYNLPTLQTQQDLDIFSSFYMLGSAGKGCIISKVCGMQF